MKGIVYVLTLMMFLIFTTLNKSQTTHDVSVENFSFTPAQLTIMVGDKVRWTNNGGLHNVAADDNSFTSGDPSSSAWVYEYTFDTPGSNPYYCSVHGGSGGVGMSGVINVEAATDVNDNSLSVREFKLEQNYPNPFNPNTRIKYSVPQSSNVLIKVFNVLGGEVATIVNEEKSTGTYNVIFNGSNLPSGVYFYKLQTGDFVQTKKMILLR